MKEIPTHSFPFKHQLYLFNFFVPYTTSPGLTVHSLAQYDSRILPLMLDSRQRIRLQNNFECL
jgi:hypothetical protein